jgi:ABC-type antimicrobial peptide transport system ATPase subunit
LQLLLLLLLQVGGPLPGGLVLPGMSGSERKQLHIACGVVAGASLVFLDEPTTGLDSCSALNIMLFLKGMATQQGATLLASVHQPRSVIWSQLDQVRGVVDLQDVCALSHYVLQNCIARSTVCVMLRAEGDMPAYVGFCNVTARAKVLHPLAAQLRRSHF